MEKDVDIDAKAKKNIFIVTFGTSDIEFNSCIFIQEGFILERVSDTNPFIERLYLFPIAFPEVKLRVKSNRNTKGLLCASFSERGWFNNLCNNILFSGR
jgi:hypothetical protein